MVLSVIYLFHFILIQTSIDAEGSAVAEIEKVTASFQFGLLEFLRAVVFFFRCRFPPPSKYTLTNGSRKVERTRKGIVITFNFLYLSCHLSVHLSDQGFYFLPLNWITNPTARLLSLT